jgi:nuclear-control-of-ATPase protein 2
MALALAHEKLNYSADQLSALAADIRLGDLTPVQQIYEEDIKSPLRSVVSGTLLRSVFIQVQKAKVDIDNALAGIDKLLKSQELTFAFVGVAPAFALVYLLGGAMKNMLVGGSRKGRYGGRKGRAGAWSAMRCVLVCTPTYMAINSHSRRRIERLLIGVNQSRQSLHADNSGAIPPLTSGLLLLSVAHLRRYAERSLPAGSRLREGFLEDVTDLEDPALGRPEKMRVVDRMWRSWGVTLGWSGVPEESDVTAL